MRMAAALRSTGGESVRVRLFGRAVVVVDVVDSVRLIQRDEAGTIARWLDVVTFVEAQLLPKFGGRIVKSLGDGLLLELPDARSAIAVALAIQDHCRRSEAAVPVDRRIALRIGIEVGDLIADARDVYGHSVNLAARLAALAGPGETVVSAGVRDRMTPDIDGDVEDLGDCFVKNLDEPIRAFRVSPIGVRPAVIHGGQAGSLLTTLAVVPFRGPLAQPEVQVVGDVLADEIIETLSRSMTINLISRLSTAAFSGRSSSVVDICRHLRAHYVLSGSFSVEGDRLQLLAELMDCATGTVVWSQRFGGSFSAADGVPVEVIDAVVARIAGSIVREEVRRARLMPLPNLQAHTLLFGAIALMHRNVLADFRLAHDLLEELINRAPRHPMPRAWMAHWQVLRVQQGWSPDIGRDGRVAMDHTRRALDADPDCALALTIDGLVNTHFLKRFDVAQERYEQAVEANPSCSLAWLLKGTMHAFMDQGEAAVDDTRRAMALSPLDPQRYYYESLAATANLAAGANETALTLAQRSLRANRKHTSTLRVIISAQWRLGQHDAARRTAAELLTLEPGFTVSAWLSRTPSASYKLGKEFSEVLRSVGIPD